MFFDVQGGKIQKNVFDDVTLTIACTWCYSPQCPMAIRTQALEGDSAEKEKIRNLTI